MAGDVPFSRIENGTTLDSRCGLQCHEPQSFGSTTCPAFGPVAPIAESVQHGSASQGDSPSGEEASETRLLLHAVEVQIDPADHQIHWITDWRRRTRVC